eukprot:CAMPEP_0174251056 /NCGR_PEP_ID=MMETSP0439-20130205/1015_1 /TAXON_ID=0 /ORGANISM="Stereomyxa ramosa, Strain Chinc5" /LENGTH=133 /DNA_ID=CAMNT_0015331283 /DNA_START=26 /DNA_END=427 /DNA_ORIENTATION=+
MSEKKGKKPRKVKEKKTKSKKKDKKTEEAAGGLEILDGQKEKHEPNLNAEAPKGILKKDGDVNTDRLGLNVAGLQNVPEPESNAEFKRKIPVEGTKGPIRGGAPLGQPLKKNRQNNQNAVGKTNAIAKKKGKK